MITGLVVDRIIKNHESHGVTKQPLPLIIYHHPCVDGFTAAWVAWTSLGPVELYPANYGQSPPALDFIRDREVYILDFSYPRDVLLAMNAVCKLTVLDHHVTAAEDLKDLDFAHFDMNASGASLVIKHFMPGIEPPTLVKYVEDRDLWKHALPYTHEISALISCMDMDINSWDSLNDMLENDFSNCISMGAGALMLRNSLVRNAVDGAEVGVLKFEEDKLVPIVCVSPEIRSDVGNALLKRYPNAPFSVCVRVTGEGYTYSLRSDDQREDVARICKTMKERGAITGGGHRNAAGFMASNCWHRYIAC